MRKFARVSALALVALTSVLGLSNVPDEIRGAGETFWQQSVQVGGALHSVLGAVLVFAVLRRRPWAVPLSIAWTIVVIYTASVATVAWQEQRDAGILVGAIMAGVSCALIGWLVVWAAREWVTRHIPATPDSPRS